MTRAAQFKLKAHAKDIDYQHIRGLQQSQMAALLMCDWLKKAQNLLLTDPCGTGKTYIACALGSLACQKGYSVRYYRLPRLILALTQAKADGNYPNLLKAIAGMDLLIIDSMFSLVSRSSAAKRLSLIMGFRNSLVDGVITS